MKTEIDYSNQTDDEKILAALKDIDNWYNGMKIEVNGVDQKMPIQDVFFHAIAEGESYKRISFLMGFSGVQGYPVVAFWNEVKDALHTMTQ